MSLTQARLKELLHYDPETGLLTNVTERGGKKAGATAGALRPNGYVQVCVDYSMYRAHRLAWLYMTGEFPPDDVDHINGVRNDNRWVNLRAATRGENMQNQRGPRSNSKSGLLGVSWSKQGKKWIAQIKVDKHANAQLRNIYRHGHDQVLPA